MSIDKQAETDCLPGFEKHLWKNFFLKKIKPLLNENHRLYFIEKDMEKRHKREKEIMELLECITLIMQLHHSKRTETGNILQKLSVHDLHFRAGQGKITFIYTKKNRKNEIFSEIISELFPTLFVSSD